MSQEQINSAGADREPGGIGSQPAASPPQWQAPQWQRKQASEGSTWPPKGQAKASMTPFKKHWWTIPKVIVAGVVAVLLAGAGGGAIGYGAGEASGPHRTGTGQYGRYHGNFGGGSGSGLGGSGSGSQGSGQSQNGSNSNNP